MKTLPGVAAYEVVEVNFEALRLALNFLGEDYRPAYFHGIAGTIFRIGGICPCAPTCTMAMDLPQLAQALGYGCETITYGDSTSDADVSRMVEAVRESIDGGVPAIVWNAYTPCEWNLVAGYDEVKKVFYGRGPWDKEGYAKKPWDQAKENAGLTGILAYILKSKTGSLDRRQAEVAALQEAVRHANDRENTDKLNGITHPAITQKIEEKIMGLETAGYSVVLLDAPTLFEAGANADCDLTVAILADEKTRLRRITERDDMNAETLTLRMNASQTDGYFTSRADAVIHNNGDSKTAAKQLRKLIDEKVF